MRISILYFHQGASTCDRKKHTGSDILNCFGLKSPGVTINFTFEILCVFAFLLLKVEALPPTQVLVGGGNIEVRLGHAISDFPFSPRPG